MAGERNLVVKVEVILPLVPLILCFSRNNSKKDRFFWFYSANKTYQLHCGDEGLLDCLMANLSPVKTANVGHWPEPELGCGKLPLLRRSTSLEIALLSGELGFLPCQSSVGCSCTARRLPGCCAAHVDEESSCAGREFQLYEPNALCYC